MNGQLPAPPQPVLAPIAWTDTTTAIVAVLALLVSIVSLALAWRAQSLAEKQEKRRSPRLLLEILDSRVRRPAGGDVIHLYEILVRNPTDTDNSIANLDYHLDYKVAGAELTLKVRASSTPFDLPTGSALVVPQAVAANQAVQGWVSFIAKQGLIPADAIDRRQVVLIDTHGNTTCLESAILGGATHED